MKTILEKLIAALLAALPCLLQAQTNGAANLPPLETVLARAADAAARESYYETNFNRRYGFLHTRVNETRNSSGKLKKREEKFMTNSPPPAVASLPLPSYASPTNGAAADPRKPSGKLIDVTDLTTNVLAHSHLTLVGRERLDGRSVLVIDFKPPDRKVAEKDLIHRLINRVAGRAWMDEQDSTLIKLEAHLVNRLNIFGGLIGAVLKGSYSFERKRTEDGLWYSRDVQWSARIREVFFYRNLSSHEEIKDVHRPAATGVVTTTQ